MTSIKNGTRLLYLHNEMLYIKTYHYENILPIGKWK